MLVKALQRYPQMGMAWPMWKKRIRSAIVDLIRLSQTRETFAARAKLVAASALAFD